ncbi:Gfo/Idh/MocA family protein [Gemmatimonadota bacterium]
MGCGEVVRVHSKILSGKAYRTRLFFTDREPPFAREANARFKGSGWFDSFDAGLRTDDIQVVFVATPPDSHLDLTIKALRRGKHVIVEKPAFLRSGDFEEVEKAAQADGRSDPRMAGGGVLFEGGVHWINLLANLGLELVRISGVRAGPRTVLRRASW